MLANLTFSMRAQDRTWSTPSASGSHDLHVPCANTSAGASRLSQSSSIVKRNLPCAKLVRESCPFGGSILGRRPRCNGTYLKVELLYALFHIRAGHCCRVHRGATDTMPVRGLSRVITQVCDAHNPIPEP